MFVLCAKGSINLVGVLLFVLWLAVSLVFTMSSAMGVGQSSVGEEMPSCWGSPVISALIQHAAVWDSILLLLWFGSWKIVLFSGIPLVPWLSAGAGLQVLVTRVTNHE